MSADLLTLSPYQGKERYEYMIDMLQESLKLGRSHRRNDWHWRGEALSGKVGPALTENMEQYYEDQ